MLKLCLAVILSLFLQGAHIVHADDTNDSDSPDLMVLPILMYSTDTGFGGGAAGLKTYNSDRARTSSLQSMFLYTAKKQAETALQWDHYFADNKSRIVLGGKYVKFPTNYYGMGNATNNNDPTQFTPEYFAFNLMLERRLLKAFRIKTKLFFRNQSLSGYDSGHQLYSSRPVPWIKGRMDVGQGISFSWDSRDNLFATMQGSFVQLSLESSLLQDEGSAFNSFEFDVRKFYNPISDMVFASMFLIKDSRGDIPFYFLAGLGGNDRLRGYEYNRFRSRSLMLLQQDFRFTIWRSLGAAVFASTGRVADHIDGLMSGQWHSAAGAGLRFYFNPEEKLLLRADYARGSDNYGIYITFGEAF